MNYTIRPESTPLGRRLQTIDIVVSRMQLSEQDNVGVRTRLPRLYDLWRGVYTGRFHPHKNNVHIPLIFAAIWSDAARKAATSLNVFPIVKFHGYGPDDEPIARKREALISAQMSDMNLFMKEIDTFVTADLYGVAITQLGWRRTEEMRITEDIKHLPISGKTIKAIRKGKVISFDGPDSEAVDRLDFFPQPKVKTIDKMRWVIRRYYRDLDDIRALAAADIFDKAELDRMETEGGIGGAMFADDALVRRFEARTGVSDVEANTLDRYSRPCEILEMWGYVPSELAPDGVLSRVITVVNRRYLMRNRPSPFWHGKLPFLAFSPTPDPHYFDAPGKAEIAEKLQITANRYVNQGLDAADLQIDPMWFYDRASNLVTRNLYSRPGRFVPVDGDPSKVIAPLVGNIQGIATARGQVEDASKFLQMGTGIFDDAVQGGGGDSRQTAREFLGRREAAGTRLLLESMIYERGYLEKYADMMVMLDKQFLEMPVEVLILGDNSKLDPVTGEPIANTREALSDWDMVPNYAARAMGATSALDESTRQSALMALAPQVAANPTIAGSINMLNFWRGIFREFEIPNINEIFKKADNPLQQFIQNATGGGTNPNAVPTTGQMVSGANPSMSLNGAPPSPLPLPSMPGTAPAADLNRAMGVA